MIYVDVFVECDSKTSTYDGCHGELALSFERPSLAKIIWAARKAGWSIGNEKHLCPHCRKGKRKNA